MRALVELDPTSSLVRYVPSSVRWMGITDHWEAGDEGILAMGWGSGTALLPYLISVSRLLSYGLQSIMTYVILQPYEAIQRRAAKDHTSFTWTFRDFDLTTAALYATQKSAAIVFINADSGEGLGAVEGNAGDRYVLRVALMMHADDLFSRNNLTAWHGGDQLVLTVAAQNNNTIVVVHSVGPLILEPWIEHPNITAVRIESANTCSLILTRYFRSCGLVSVVKKLEMLLSTFFTVTGIHQADSHTQLPNRLPITQLDLLPQIQEDRTRSCRSRTLKGMCSLTFLVVVELMYSS